jgi:hypothetical protein
MRTASKTLRSLINSGIPATGAADKRAAPDQILAGSLPADGRDERRITRHDNGVAIRIGCSVIRLSKVCEIGRKYFGSKWPAQFRKQP